MVLPANGERCWELHVLRSEASPEDRFHRDGWLRLDVQRESPLRSRGASLQQSLLHLDGSCSARPTGAEVKGQNVTFSHSSFAFK